MKRLLASVLALLVFSVCITGCPTDSGGLPQPPPPPEVEPDETLANTSWVWESMGTTLDFTSATEVSNGVDTYAYSYVDADKAGSIETLGDFTLSGDGGSLSFTAYNGFMAAEFKRYVEEPEAFPETLANTQWQREGETLIFHTAELLQLGAEYYPYTYNREAKTGTITDRNGAKLADFSLDRNAKTLSFAVSEAYPEGADFLPKGEVDLTLDDLAGSRWIWPNLVLTFTTEDVVELSSKSSDTYLFYYRYTYDKVTKKGRIVYDPTINENTPENPADLGSFSINAAYSALSFVQYKDYPHGARFDRLLEE
jgi:hypothetical protein